MAVMQFYRLYICLGLGLFSYFYVWHSFWLGLLLVIAIRVSWFGIDSFLEKRRIKKLYASHVYQFKQQGGPYAIRMANKAEEDYATMKSLCEVFVHNKNALKKTVEQLDMMNTLFSAGMRPDGDTYQLHDLKLKYGKHRLEKDC
jgi:hypothetical protein